MPVYLRPRIQVFQIGQQLPKTCDLSGRACVSGCHPIASAPSDIAHADAVGVVTSAMCASDVHIAPTMDCAVTINNIVIPYITPSTIVDVVITNLANCIVAPSGRCRTMNDNFSYEVIDTNTIKINSGDALPCGFYPSAETPISM